MSTQQESPRPTRRANRDPLVNYDELEHYENVVREEFPDADLVRAFPNGEDHILVEVRELPFGENGPWHRRSFEGSPYKRRGRRRN